MVILDWDSDDRFRHHDALALTLTLSAMPLTPPADEKPYHAKRPHRKSRLGCRNCKSRKVKCDEKKPSCRNCTLRKESCLYPSSQAASGHQQPQASSTASRAAAATATATGAAGSAAAAAAAAAAPAASAPAPSSTPPPSSCSVSALSSRPRVTTADPVSPSTSAATCSPLSQRSALAVTPVTPTSLSLAQRSSPRFSLAGSCHGSHDASPGTYSDHGSSHGLVIVDEPPVKFGGADEYDMKLLWFYTTETYGSFSIEPQTMPFVDHILKSQIVKYAFQSPFLMDCILGLSALHMQSLNMTVPLSKAITYRARAFAGYRQAIEKADPRDFPALLACSLLLCALSSELFREGDMKPLYIIDWMVVWRGIGLIVEIIPPDALFASGLEKLFSRPSFDLEKAAMHIPANLLFMITTIKEGDIDYPHVDTYYKTLKFLGGLYRELDRGISPILSLRIITWFTFLPKPFVELARRHRPRALVILAHYLSFLKMIPSVWWLAGISDRGIQDIIDNLGPKWQGLLSVPRSAMQVYDKVDLAKLIKGNHAWEPPEPEHSAVNPKLAMVNDVGEEVTWDKERGWVPFFNVSEPENSSSSSRRGGGDDAGTSITRCDASGGPSSSSNVGRRSPGYTPPGS